MKKMIAALVLATSFAAFADDAARLPAGEVREEDHGEEDHRDQGRPAAKPAPATEKAPEKK
jgi:hypothetical protein